MEKVVEFLEKYVQWLALAIAGVCVLIASYFYLIQTPVSATIGSQTVNPGTVDTVIHGGVANRLKTAVNDPDIRPQVVIPPEPTAFNDIFTTATAPVATIKTGPFGAIAGDNIADSSTPLPNDGNHKVTDLVKLQPAVVTELLTGRSNVGIPVLLATTGAPAPGAAASAPGVAPAPAAGRLFDPNQASARPAAASGNPSGTAVANVKAEDRLWVRVNYDLPTLDLVQEFTAKFLDVNTQTSFLRVKVLRQEMIDGKWGPTTEIPPLKNAIAPALPPATPPKSKTEERVFSEYLVWAASDAGIAQLIQPPFYTIVLGDNPWAPTAVAPVIDADQAAQNEAERKKAEAEERKAKQEADKEERRRRAEEARQSRGTNTAGGGNRRSGSRVPGNTGPTGYGPGGYNPNGSGRGPLVQDPARGSDPFRQDATGTVPRTVTPGTADAAKAIAPVTPLPAGAFAPGGLLNDTEGWAWDDTVETGKTYRYQILWAIQNPIFGMKNVAANPALQGVFAIWSEERADAWSSEITVSSLTNFFVVKPWNSRSVNAPQQVTVFKWQSGKWQSEIFNVSPGERVGGEKNGVDFSTGYTLVDVRYEETPTSARQTAILMGPDGKIVTRDPNIDKESPVYKDLAATVAAQQAAPADAAAAATN